ncbi:hypothetical protein J25TS5_24690 [Paenibacillus faecis]|uniref:hypothetical protein n=1 Tax=Paenibacillus faecis TaxID=862114 RepID=UPI001B0F8159|nr:hypothetical protein [Paenibacillus faecis]GIO85537.1 hypothetical protein J25TS5_24690 [Paenibacillus faecis]
MKTPASEVIRKAALKILVKYPRGLSLADLRFKTEEELKRYIPPDGQGNGKYRSALWDLEKRHPEYITKDNSGRAAKFVPTEKLQQEAAGFDIPAYAPTAREVFEEGKRASSSAPCMDYLAFKSKVTEIIAFVEQSEIGRFHISAIREAADPEEIKNLTKAMIFLEGLLDLKYTMQQVKNKRF